MSKSKCPNESWSIDRLGAFCNRRRKRMGDDAWWIGKAIQIAKSQVKHGEFTAWKRKYGFSDSVAGRYMRICKKHRSPEEIKGQTITEVLKADGKMSAPKAKVIKGDASPPNQSGGPQADGTYSWEDKKSSESVNEAPEDSGRQLTAKVGDRETQTKGDLGSVFVDQLSSLRMTVETILSMPDEEREKLWPPMLVASIKTAVIELNEGLSRLEWDLPPVEEHDSSAVAAKKKQSAK